MSMQLAVAHTLFWVFLNFLIFDFRRRKKRREGSDHISFYSSRSTGSFEAEFIP